MNFKEILKKFFSNKINLALIIIQIVAIIMYFLAGISSFCYVSFFILEGAFLILWGVSLLLSVAKIKRSSENYSKLPYSKEDIEIILKNDGRKIKSYRFTAIVLILIGAFLIVNIFLLI